MRLFLALEIPEQVRANLAAIRKTFSSMDSQLRWVPPHNFHVTLKFIGSVPTEKLQSLIEALSRVRVDKSVKLNFRGMGGSTAGVYWVAIEGCPALAALAASIDHSLEPLGIPEESHAFHPHLTIARFKDRKILRKLDELIRENGNHGKGHYPECDFGSMSASEFHLVESTTLPAGPIYSKVQSFPFVTAAAGN
jgi:RNA 2',3'-cyclic 3'-phosphodiesterase